MQKKIAIISTEVNFTGANQSLFDWLSEADREKYDFIIIFPRYNEKIWAKCESLNCKAVNGFYFHEYKRIGRECIKNALTVMLNVFWNPIVELRLKRILKQEKVIIVHSNTFATLLGASLSKKLKIPHVWHLREFMEEDYQITHFNNRVVDRFIDGSYPIYISQVIKHKYFSRFKKGTVIYDQVQYDPMINHIVQQSPKKFKILMAGTLAENKGQMDAVLAVERLLSKGYPVELYICGDGPDKSKINHYISSHKLENNIIMMGFVDNLKELRTQMDISFVCSKMEALGRVTVENMYYQNLTIGADCGCTKELIAENRGIPYVYGDIDSLVEATQKAIESWDKCIDIMNNAKLHSIEVFSKAVFQQIYNVYDEVLKE